MDCVLINIVINVKESIKKSAFSEVNQPRAASASVADSEKGGLI